MSSIKNTSSKSGTFYGRFFSKKEPKPGKLTKSEKRQVWDLNPNMPLTFDSTILKHADVMPASYVERQNRYRENDRRRKRDEDMTARFAYRKTLKNMRQSSNLSDYGDDIRYLHDNDLDTFLQEQGIRTVKGGIKRRTRKHKKRQRTRKHRK